MEVELEHFSLQEPLKQMLLAFNTAVCERLDAIESRLDCVSDYCQTLEEKVEMLSSLVRDSTTHTFVSAAASPGSVSSEEGSGGSTVPLGSNVTLITLNTEADYPNGSWLGDENNPEMRVRCHITPTDLFHINTTCSTAEKMALTLLDYLFDRETQACSNISGTGKHKKKQLDPLMIYGIRCHLIYKFGIGVADWNRIKQNLDSKCRTAFRRKRKGLPLASKRQDAGSPSLTNDSATLNSTDGVVTDISATAITGESVLRALSADVDIPELGIQPTFSLHSTTVECVDQQEVAAVMQEAQVIRTQHGDIQVLHATPEQLAQIQQTHQIQILTGGHLLATPVEEDSCDSEESPLEENNVQVVKLEKEDEFSTVPE